MENRKLNNNDYKRLSIKCIIFSILGILLLYLTNYDRNSGAVSMPNVLFISMLVSAALLLLIGVIGFVITSVNNRKDS